MLQFKYSRSGSKSKAFYWLEMIKKVDRPNTTPIGQEKKT